MKIKTSELEGAALDWAVAQVSGAELDIIDMPSGPYIGLKGRTPDGFPSQMRSQGWMTTSVLLRGAHRAVSAKRARGSRRNWASFATTAEWCYCSGKQKGNLMKHIAILSVVAALAGCAGMPGQAEPPHYDHSRQALTGEGYPVEIVYMPDGLSLAEVERVTHEINGATFTDVGAGWNSSEGETVVASAIYRSIAAPHTMAPMPNADGYEFIGGNKVVHFYQSGRYTDIAGDAPDLIPDNAPSCAYGVGLSATSMDATKRFIGVYSRGVACNDIAGIPRSDYEDARHRAYQAFGLR